MRKIKRKILRGIGYFVCITVMFVFISRIPDIIAGDYTIDIRDLWYDYKDANKHYYIILAVLYMIALSEIWDFCLNRVDSVGSLVFYFVLGNFFLLFINWLYSKCLNTLCLIDKESSIYLSFENTFDSLYEASWYYTVYDIEKFSLAIICIGIPFFLKNSILKTCVKEIFLTEYRDEQYVFWKEGILFVIVIMGNSFFTVFMELPVKVILNIIEGIIIPVYIVIKIIEVVKKYIYYKMIFTSNINKKRCVSYKRYDKMLDKQIHYIEENLKKKNIYLIPESLGTKYNKNEIILKMYNSDKKEIMEDDKYIFNVIYSPPDMKKIKDDEYIIVINEKEAVQKIEYCCDFVLYRKWARILVGRIEIEKNKWTNAIVEEIIIFRKYISNAVDQFLVLDYSIKWLEIINYMFALAHISEHKIQVQNKEIELADFNKWLLLRKKYKDEILDIVYPGHKIFQILNLVSKNIMKRECEFKKYSLEEIFDTLIILRNYTRGHGVYTFEITQRLNLQIISILVFLINRLLESGKLDKTLGNLEQYGWIVYMGDIPYFLYSFDKNELEYSFNSFQKGNSITLPIDYKAENYEDN